MENNSIAESDEPPLDTIIELKEETDENSVKFESNSISKRITIKETNFEYENGTGEIYMRVGLAIFTLCALISHIIHLIQMIEAYSSDKGAIVKCKITFFITVISKTSCVIFILIQSAFIFKYANIVLNSGKNVAIIGLMHIICTNFCLFVRTVISETDAEIRHEEEHGVDDHLFKQVNTSIHKRGIYNTDTPLIRYKQFKNLGCINVSISDTSKNIQQTQNYLAELLYPIVIEYSLLAMTIFYVLWSSFKSRYCEKTQRNSYDMKPIENRRMSIFQSRRASVSGKTNVSFKSVVRTHDRRHNSNHSSEEINRFTIDCTKSTTG